MSFIASLDGFVVSFLEQFGERINPNEIRKIFREIQQEQDELVPTFNLRFMKAVKHIPEPLRPSDAKSLIMYLGAFDNEMSYLIRDKEPKTLL